MEAGPIIHEILNSFELNLREIRLLVADIDDTQIHAQPVRGMNHPGWQLGHIVFSLQAIGGEMGIPPWLDEQWLEHFGQGSVLLEDPTRYPPKSVLLTALDDAAQRIRTRLEHLDEAALAAPLPDARFKDAFPTLGHAVLHILIGHLSNHTGQLRAWRRAAQLPPLGQPDTKSK